MSGPINLTEVDFEEIKDNLVSYLKSTKQFTDYDFDGSNLQVILNLIAYQAQLNAYSTNLIANESFLPTATIRKNVVANARSLGYVPTSAKSAHCNITFNFQLRTDNYPAGFPLFVEIRPGMTFTTSTGKSGYTFNVIDTQITPVNNQGVVSFNEIPIHEGVYLTAEFTVDESEFNQKFILENNSIDTSTLRIEVQEDPSEQLNQFYRRADNLVELTEESRIYWLEEVDRKYYELTFGDGLFGKKLQNGAKIFVTYLVSDGELANGIKGVNNYSFVGNCFDSDGTRVTTKPTIIDVTATEGGSEIEDIGSIKFRAPREYSTQNRCVVAEDYEAIVRKVYPPTEDIYVFGGEKLEIPEFGRIYVIIKPKTGDRLSNSTKNYIKKSLDPYRVGSLDIIIGDPEVLHIELISRIYFDEKKTLKDSTAIVTAVRDSLMKYKKSNTVSKFGSAIKYSNIVGVIDDSDPSITRNNTTLLMRRDFTAIINANSTYEVCFNQQILLDKEARVLYSTGFNLEINGDIDPRTFYFENDPQTIRQYSESDPELISDIFCYYYNDFNDKIKVNFYLNTVSQLTIVDVPGEDKQIVPFGVLYLNRGEVELGYKFTNGIKFVGTERPQNIIEIRTKPYDQDIFAKESVFLELDIESSDIESSIELKVAN